MNGYEFADRATTFRDSIKCGPDGRRCDQDYLCPAHGGDHSHQDDWTEADEVALQTYVR